MRKMYSTYEQAVVDYNEYYGKCPTVNEIDELYHRYRCEWKGFDSFADWLMNYTA